VERDFGFSVQRTGRRLVGELADGVGDPAPNGRSIIIILGGELVGARGAFLESIPAMTLRDLRDRALIATLTYSFARINAALKMKVEDLRPRGAGWTVRLHEKGGKEHAMPCHHALAEALRAYIDAAKIAEDRKGWLFRTARGHKADALSDRPMNQSDAWLMKSAAARRRPVSMRRSAITRSERPGSPPISPMAARSSMAQEMAAHESPRTTKLYDRTRERLTQDEVERIRL
jgi:integrase